MDLGCTGPKFTWTNNRRGMANTMERLNRALCNENWRTMYPQGTVRNLPRTYSDHFPLIIYTEEINLKLSLCEMIMESGWLTHKRLKLIFKVIFKICFNLNLLSSITTGAT
ncbi:hypothetical protein ACSBR1_034272 [Camellia fascicularis]